MWAHLQNWVVQDGEVPELRAGSTLHDHGLRASCWSIRQSATPVGTTELRGPDPSGDDAPHYELSGTVEWGQAPSSVLLRVGGFRVLAEPHDFRPAPGRSPDDHAVQRFSPDFFVPPVGDRAIVRCQLEVMADYEVDIDGTDCPELRTDWLVQRIRLQHRALVPGRLPSPRAQTRVIRTDDIERMQRWADEEDGDQVTYLLDLQPLP